jgi:hypothetical protein
MDLGVYLYFIDFRGTNQLRTFFWRSFVSCVFGRFSARGAFENTQNNISQNIHVENRFTKEMSKYRMPLLPRLFSDLSCFCFCFWVFLASFSFFGMAPALTMRLKKTMGFVFTEKNDLNRWFWDIFVICLVCRREKGRFSRMSKRNRYFKAATRVFRVFLGANLYRPSLVVPRIAYSHSFLCHQGRGGV